MEKLIEFRDITGHYLDEGKGDVLMLIHGYCGDSSVWEPVVSKLTANFRVIRPDLPGFGKTTLSKEPLTVEWMADFIHEICRFEVISKAVILGHSMGGYVSLAFASAYPNILSGLGLIHSHCYADSDEKKSKRKRALKFLKENNSDGFVKELYKTLFTPEYIAANLEVIEQLISQAMTYSKNSLIAGYEAMLKRYDRSDVLKKIQLPVLFFSGKKDQSIDFELSVAQSTLPKIADIHFFDHVGHMGMYEATRPLINIISDFMELTSVRRQKETSS